MAQHSSNETIIAQGVKVEGDFHSSGDVIIDGEVTGSIETTQALTIGESARIHANVEARSASIAGEVRGNIVAHDRLELLATSVVEGDISTADLLVASGAQINGDVTMGKISKASRDLEEDEDEEA